MKEEIVKVLKEKENILITAHKNPDGDAVGAGLALMLSLKEMGKKLRFVLQDKIPDTTLFLEGSQAIEIYQEGEDFSAMDCVVFVDCANRERAGKMNAATQDILSINIDHHMSNPHYGDYSYVEHISATSEILTHLLREWNFPVTEAVAMALYLGIVNDTGNFSHDNVTKKTLEAAQYLVEKGARASYIVRNFLNTSSYASLKLLGEALANFVYLPEVKLVHYYLSQAVMKKYGARKEHTEGIVEKLLSYEEASVALFLREEEDGSIKGSMRSKWQVDVNQIAGSFGGGGHVKAAGFSSYEELDEIIKKVVSQL